MGEHADALVGDDVAETGFFHVDTRGVEASEGVVVGVLAFDSVVLGSREGASDRYQCEKYE